MTTYAPGSPVILTEDGHLIVDGVEVKHMGPGPHPGTGTPQIVHAIGAVLNLFNLNDGKGGFEKRLRVVADTVGVDPYDVDLKKLKEHADLHEREAVSRFPTKSPCWAVKAIDFTVHRWLPGILAEKYPELAQALLDTSPRWGRLARSEEGTLPLPEMKHMGPGPHPSGTPQLVHRGGGVGYSAAVQHLSDLLVADNDRTRTVAGRLFETYTGGIGPDERAHGTLDLEWMGQFAPVKPGPDAETTTRRAREYLRTLPTYDESDEAHEQAIVVLADGSIEGNHVKIGSAQSIPMGKGRDYIGKDVVAMLHNHPRDNPLSVGDLMAMVNIMVEREEAVTRSGHYALVIDWGAVGSPVTLATDVGQMRRGIVDFAQAWVNSGRLTEDQLRYGAGDAASRALAEKVEHVTYERTGTWGGDEEWPQEMVDRLKQWIQS